MVFALRLVVVAVLAPTTIAFKFQSAPPKRRVSGEPRTVTKNDVSAVVQSCDPPYIVQAVDGGDVEVICPCCGSKNNHGLGLGMRGVGAERLPNPAYMHRVCDGFAWGKKLFGCPGYWLILADPTFYARE